jgi:hypothetical protein
VEGVLVRYPVRMKEDLLPFTNLTTRETVELLGKQLRKTGCQATEDRVLDLVDQQLSLKGTLILTLARAGSAAHSPIVFRLLPRGAHDLSLEKDSPETRPIQPSELGSVVELPEVGGLHHRGACRPHARRT